MTEPRVYRLDKPELPRLVGSDEAAHREGFPSATEMNETTLGLRCGICGCLFSGEHHSPLPGGFWSQVKEHVHASCRGPVCLTKHRYEARFVAPRSS